ncbi:MAG: thioesterase family protein [Anaerovoracaceae bacterium]|jgi:acyl-CoA thioester hydrolase
MSNWFTTSLRVRYKETDQMGVVYHSNYFVWFDIARTELIRSVNISFQDMEDSGLLMPVIDVNCQYRVPAKCDDVLLIKVKISRYTNLRMNFVYEVIREADNQLLATGETKHVFIDRNFKPRRLDKEIPEYHGKMLQLFNS